MTRERLRRRGRVLRVRGRGKESEVQKERKSEEEVDKEERLSRRGSRVKLVGGGEVEVEDRGEV